MRMAQVGREAGGGAWSGSDWHTCRPPSTAFVRLFPLSSHHLFRFRTIAQQISQQCRVSSALQTREFWHRLPHRLPHLNGKIVMNCSASTWRTSEVDVTTLSSDSVDANKLNREGTGGCNVRRRMLLGRRAHFSAALSDCSEQGNPEDVGWIHRREGGCEEP